MNAALYLFFCDDRCSELETLADECLAPAEGDARSLWATPRFFGLARH